MPNCNGEAGWRGLPHRPDHELSSEWREIWALLKQADDVQRTGATDVAVRLGEINALTVMSVPGALYGGVTLIDDTGALSTVGATHRFASVLDDIQRECGQGPWLSTARNQHTIRIDDLAAEDRWPRYREAALQRTAVRSVVSYRLFDDGKCLAALNLYANTAGVFDNDSIEIGLVFAAHTTLVWNTMRRERQFRSALASRDIIGQAKGILMERFRVDAVAAFDLLRKLSQQSNVKLLDIAEKIIAARPPLE